MIVDELVAILGYDVKGEAELKRFNDGLNKAEKSASAFAKRLAVVGAAAATAFAAGATALAKSVISTGRQFENYRLQLETLEGSSEKAAKAMDWIKQFAKDTPLELSDVIDSYASLKNFGIDPTNGSLMALVDAMAASGKGKEHLSGISLALGQAWAKEKLQGEEILQLVERGIPVWDMLSKATGKTSKQLQELSSKGKLGRETITKLIEEMGKRYAGASEKFAKSFDGITSKMADEWTGFLSDIADAGFYDDIKRRLETVFDTIDGFSKDGTLKRAAEQISRFMSGSMNFAEHIGGQIYTIGKGAFYAADGMLTLISRVSGLNKAAAAGVLAGGALAMSAGGRGMLAAIAKRVPALGALLLIDDIMTGVKGGDSYIGSLEGGQEALGALRKQLEDLSKAFNDLSAAMGSVISVNLNDWDFTSFMNRELVRFVQDLTNVFNDLSAAVRTVGDLLGTKSLEESQARGGRINTWLESNFGDYIPKNWLGGPEKGGRVGGSFDNSRFDGRGAVGTTSGAMENWFEHQRRMGASGAATAAVNDNRNQSVGDITINQTVQQATQAPAAAASATANAVRGAAVGAARVSRFEKDDAF